MHDQGMGIDWSIGDAILPMRSAIQAADQCSSLHGDEDTPGNMQVGRDPTHMTGSGLGRKTPGRGGRKFTEGLEFLPGLPSILSAEQTAGLGSYIDHALFSETIPMPSGNSRNV